MPDSSYRELMTVEIERDELRPQDDDALAKLLQLESQAAATYRTIDDDREVDGYGYYYADRNYRNYTRVDSRSNTSRMVSKDVAESVDDMMPNLMRVLQSNDQLVEFEAADAAAVPHVDSATAALNDEFRAQDDFEDHLEDWVKEGLLTSSGVFEIQVIEPREIPETVTGVMPDALPSYAQDSRVRVEVKREHDDGRLDIVLWHGEPRRLRFESHPSNDLLVSPEATSLDQRTPEGARYVGLRKEMTVGAAISQWPDKRDAWLRAAAMGEGEGEALDENTGLAGDVRYLEESRGASLPGADQTHGNLFARQITIMREYYRVDMDGDKWPELLAIVRVGKTIVQRAPVLNNPFAGWTPYRVPHTFRGEGQAAKSMDLQDYKTAFWRIANDSAAMASMQRYAINEDAASRRPEIPFISDLLRFEPGSPVRTPGDPREMVTPLTGQDVTQPAMTALQYADQVKEGWTGQSRRQRGLDPEAVANESGVKYDKILSAGNGRIEFIANNLAKGIKLLARKALDMMIAYGPEKDVLINGVWTRINPSEWQGRMRPVVHISGATGSIDLEVQYGLMLIQTLQGFVSVAGPTNPWVGHQQLAEAVRELVHSLGFRAAERFIQRPQQEAIDQYLQALSQQEDPKVTIEKLKAEVEQARMQVEATKDKYRLDIDRLLGLLRERVTARVESRKLEMQGEHHDDDIAVRREQIEAQRDIAQMQADTQKEVAAKKGSENGTGRD